MLLRKNKLVKRLLLVCAACGLCVAGLVLARGELRTMGLILFVYGAAVFPALLLRRFFPGVKPAAEEPEDPRGRRLGALVLAVTVLTAVLPMGLSPEWNGEIPAHRNQYELMADAFLEGHLYIDYDDVDPRLLEMENPYDPEAREELGVNFHWDHAWYNGHYYSYFGVVPELLLFLPFRVLTGHPLVTYHATQIFTALYIWGLFALLGKLTKRFFKTLPLRLWLLMASCFSLLSVWSITSTPAMYCTAISAGICMEIWSLNFFFRAVYMEERENKQIALAAVGALLGALAFGCRPPVALGNLVVIPMLIQYLRQKGKISLKLAGKLFCAVLPYFAVGAGLMWYNYVRFDSPFEFGQSYQLTLADQHLYGDVLANLQPMEVIRFVYFSLCGIQASGFPGLMWEFPVLLFSLLIVEKRVARNLKDKGLLLWGWSMGVSAVVICIAQALSSPLIMERYKQDFLWLLVVLTFLVIAAIWQSWEGKRRTAAMNMAWVLSLHGLLSVFALFFVAHDENYVMYYFGSTDNFLKAIIKGLLGR